MQPQQQLVRAMTFCLSERNWANLAGLIPPQRPTNNIVPKQIALVVECKLNWTQPVLLCPIELSPLYSAMELI